MAVMSERYTPTIGLEIHAELCTKSKMFCGCPNDPHCETPNTNVCPICVGHPGTLPVVNKEAVRKLLMVGAAINGTRATYSEFDRKHYFYPDIPKAYQISQYAFPIISGGSLAGVPITRIHLEEDTATSQHAARGESSRVNFNRAGVPLMELVTEPAIHDAHTAAVFARELQLLLRSLEVSTAHMEWGEMRVEANISLAKEGRELGTKVEVKNLNSFKSVERAINYEIKRQQDLLEKGENVVPETRGYDEEHAITFSQRSKETAEDYRYFPDPDIPKFQFAELAGFQKSRIEKEMPELPENKRDFLSLAGVSEKNRETLVEDKELYTLFKTAYTCFPSPSAETAATLANYIVSDIAGMETTGTKKSGRVACAPQLAELITLVVDGEISSRVAKDLLPEIFAEGISPRQVAKERNLLMQTDDSSLRALALQIAAENPAVIADFQAGKENALQYLVGQAMKATKGAADPKRMQEIFKEVAAEKK